MPYPADHKAKTRERIIASARGLFNRRGFEQVTIDDLMKEAGLTRGGFYHHFKSKDELYAEAVRSFARCSPFRKRAARMHRPAPKTLASLLIRLYLSDETLADIDNHCPLIALPSDVARAGLKPRAAYTALVANMLRVFRAAFPPGDLAAEAKARVIVSMCVGGMVLARTTNDANLRASLRAAARKSALDLLETGNKKRAKGGAVAAPARRMGKRRERRERPKRL
jgi:AcrR family transcriptional regulator